MWNGGQVLRGNVVLHAPAIRRRIYGKQSLVQLSLAKFFRAHEARREFILRKFLCA